VLALALALKCVLRRAGGCAVAVHASGCGGNAAVMVARALALLKETREDGVQGARGRARWCGLSSRPPFWLRERQSLPLPLHQHNGGGVTVVDMPE
jgi:hypothetical protein